MKTLPVEQLQSFLREAGESGVFELYYLELATGLRRGELLGLKWEDIDLERGDLRVKRQVVRINGVVTEAPENKKRLPYPSVGRRYGKRFERAEEKSGQQPMGVPVTQRWANLTGQRPPHAPPGAEAGGAAQGQVS